MSRAMIETGGFRRSKLTNSWIDRLNGSAWITSIFTSAIASTPKRRWKKPCGRLIARCNPARCAPSASVSGRRSRSIPPPRLPAAQASFPSPRASRNIPCSGASRRQAVFPACTRHGIGNLAFSPLAHGVLTGKYEPGAPPAPGSRAANDQMNIFMETAGRHFRSDYLLEAVARLQPIADELGLTMVQLALAWVLRRPEVASAIIGASRPEQIADNVRAVGVTLTRETMERIDQALNGAIVRN